MLPCGRQRPQAGRQAGRSSVCIVQTALIITPRVAQRRLVDVWHEHGFYAEQLMGLPAWMGSSVGAVAVLLLADGERLYHMLCRIVCRRLSGQRLSAQSKISSRLLAMVLVTTQCWCRELADRISQLGWHFGQQDKTCAGLDHNGF